jgi:hypothetical protein
MRMELKAATLTLAVLLGACSRREEPTATLSDDLKRDLAAASAPGDLAVAPQSYQRMRFVSDAERTRAAQPAKRPKVTRNPIRPTVRRAPKAETVADVSTAKEAVAEAPAQPAPAEPVSAPLPEPMVIAQRPTPDPVYVPSRGSPGDGGMGERGRNGGIGGIGGILGGIFTGVVIRGGHGGVDKCDPRTDGRGRGGVIDRPVFGMPVPTGRTTFPTRL